MNTRLGESLLSPSFATQTFFPHLTSLDSSSLCEKMVALSQSIPEVLSSLTVSSSEVRSGKLSDRGMQTPGTGDLAHGRIALRWREGRL